MATQTKLVTYDDYLTLPDDGNQYEVIGGELIMAASPITKHERISRKLLIRLDNYIEKYNIGEVFDAPFDVVLSMTDVVQPDLMYISKERSHIITEKNIVEAPDLVVEIISNRTKVRDQTTKKTLYEEHGVKEYWLVYPNEEKVEQFILKDEELELKQTFKQSDTLSCATIEGFTLPLNKIFEN
jgi:Uma2 family endonuclease